MKLQNHVFTVTGAGGGIGGALVLALLARGAKVAAIDVKNDSLQALQARAGAPAGNLSLHVADITDRQAAEQLPAAILAELGSLDGLINCAGIVQPFVKVADLDYQAIDRVMNINFYGTLYMTKAFLPLLLQRPEAYLVNVSSMGGFLPVPGQSVYGASKAAVKLLTEGLYAELLHTPVHVSVVFPGATNTNITQNSQVAAPAADGAQAAKMAANLLSPEAAADIIIRGMEKNKPQIFTGSDASFMNRLYRLNPTYATKFIAKKMAALLS